MIYRTRNPWFRSIDSLLHDARPLLEGRSEFANPRFAPALDVEESADGFTVRADIPGVKLEDISVNLHEDVLTISGETASERSADEGRLVIRERRAGKFSRSLRFPATVNGEAVSASFDDGVLVISLPKAEAHTPRAIPVNVAAAVS